MIDKNRLLAITDGIIAIAATIMVLQLDIPTEASFRAVAAQWPTMLAYIISFLQIFLAWHEHHDSIANAEHINHRIFLINCLWLFFVTLLPFATGVIGHSLAHAPSMRLYIVVLLLVQLSITVESKAIEKLNNCPILDREVIHVIRYISVGGYMLAGAGTFYHAYLGFGIVIALTTTEIILICLYDRKINQKVKAILQNGTE
ncbi:TMEM175 family protein [Eubacterium sp. AB3007]|jgi:uncharacterized membrane protein|uniref:TMEM175 family protein n=1 Tax=Eubacterium sp. AB3007 TaxID=1392487 RepID=UPI00068ACC19|nr:TMEM175 family protein [Eubacterium sp. AB3007]